MSRFVVGFLLISLIVFDIMERQNRYLQKEALALSEQKVETDVFIRSIGLMVFHPKKDTMLWV